MEINCPNCNSQMCETDPGVEKTDVSFCIDFTCSCGAEVEVSFSVDCVTYTDPEGEQEDVEINDIIS